MWLGNNRGNTYSHKHRKYSPHDERFWNWTLDDLILHDIPAMINVSSTNTLVFTPVCLGCDWKAQVVIHWLFTRNSPRIWLFFLQRIDCTKSEHFCGVGTHYQGQLFPKLHGTSLARFLLTSPGEFLHSHRRRYPLHGVWAESFPVECLLLAQSVNTSLVHMGD